MAQLHKNLPLIVHNEKDNDLFISHILFPAARSQALSDSVEQIADDQYELKFNVINAYQDLSEMSAKAFLQGDVRDPEIRLHDTSVTIKRTDYFDPAEYIVYSFDGHSENVADKKY